MFIFLLWLMIKGLGLAGGIITTALITFAAVAEFAPESLEDKAANKLLETEK